MGTSAGTGVLVAELTDAANVGASEFYNSPGEFYFTLPATHPQVAVIEPYQCHYELQLHTGQGWRGKWPSGSSPTSMRPRTRWSSTGRTTSACLGRIVEERFTSVDAELPTDKGGGQVRR